MAQINVLSSTALKPTLDEVLPEFERKSGCAVAVTFGPSAQIKGRIAELPSTDVVIATGEAFHELVRLGTLATGHHKNIARSVIGLAVRVGAKRPDISTPDQFKRAMICAKSIAMSNPEGGGVSGAHLAKVFKRLGIADEIKSRLIYGPGGPQGLIGNFVRCGKAEIGLQQIPELRAVPGIAVVGPLPDDLQMVTLYSVGLSNTARNPDVGKALIEFLGGPTVRAVLQSKGMDT
jgi:molybdate transport system substrate-binding protein